MYKTNYVTWGQGLYVSRDFPDIEPLTKTRNKERISSKAVCGTNRAEKCETMASIDDAKVKWSSQSRIKTSFR